MLAWTDEDRFDEAGARRIAAALRGRGLRPLPNLFTVLAERGEEQWDPAFDSPGVAVPAERLTDTVVTLHRTCRPALGGVAGVTLVAACVGWYRWPPYAALVLFVGVVIGACVWRGFPSVYHRLPRAAPRGTLLGASATVAALLLALAGLVAIRAATGL